MAVKSDPNEAGETGFPPVGADRAELVHEARKAIKRMRALARLLRHELGEQEFERVNCSLRAAGRRLAGARDADVRLATLEQLKTRHPKALAPGVLQRLGERLERERHRPNGGAPPQDVLADIAEMRRQLAAWNVVERRDFQALTPGLRRIYREGRLRYARVKREQANNAEHLHDWRKRVKSLYYVLDILGGADAKGARRATRRAERLGDLLGEEHDLWMLSTYLEQHPDILNGAALEKLLKRIERRRRRLRKRALELGSRLYKRKAGTFVQRIGSALSR